MARVLHIDRQRHWTGQQARTYQILKFLREKGHEPVLVCSPGSTYETKAAADGIPFHVLRMRGKAIPGAVFKLARLLRREGIELVDAHGSVDHQLAAFAALLRRPRLRPVVVRSKHKNVPLKSGPLSRFVYERLTRRIVAISQAVKDQLVADGIRPEQVELIHTAVDVRRFTPGREATAGAAFRERLGIARDAFVFGTVSRLHASKGIPVMLRAFTRLAERAPDAIYVCAGRGGPRRYSKEKAAALGIPEGRVIFPGHVDGIQDLYAALDVFALPSITEGLGTVSLEAMACAKPVIGSRTGGIPEAVVDGETGLLVPPGDEEALLAALARLHADRALARRLGEAGRRRVEELFDARQMLARTLELYVRLLAERGGHAPLR